MKVGVVLTDFSIFLPPIKNDHTDYTSNLLNPHFLNFYDKIFFYNKEGIIKIML